MRTVWGIFSRVVRTGTGQCGMANRGLEYIPKKMKHVWANVLKKSCSFNIKIKVADSGVSAA